MRASAAPPKFSGCAATSGYDIWQPVAQQSLPYSGGGRKAYCSTRAGGEDRTLRSDEAPSDCQRSGGLHQTGRPQVHEVCLDHFLPRMRLQYANLLCKQYLHASATDFSSVCKRRSAAASVIGVWCGGFVNQWTASLPVFLEMDWLHPKHVVWYLWPC